MINAYKQHVGWTDRLGNQGKSTFESDALKQGEFHEFCRHLQPGLHCMKYMEYKKEPWYPGLLLFSSSFYLTNRLYFLFGPLRSSRVFWEIRKLLSVKIHCLTN